MQGTAEFIAKSKVKSAAQIVNGAAIVEDVSLVFNAFGGLPGPYIKDFMTNVGNSGLVKMLDKFEDKTAYAQCIYAFCESPKSEPVIFVGRCKGKIVTSRGDNAFGWDPIFQPDGFAKTFAEMSSEEKNSVSHRNEALKHVKKFLVDN